MTVPQELMLAQSRFDDLLQDLMAALDLTTRHQAYAVLHAVLRVFRRRLDARETLLFCDALPPLARAVFVAEWNEAGERAGWRPSDDYDAEARAVRTNHNLMPAGSFALVTAAIRRRCERDRFEAALDRLPAGARAFWGG